VANEFPIDVVIVPKTSAGTQQIAGQLDRLEKEALDVKRALIEALSVRDQGVSQALLQINATLERTETQALITDARISQIGRDVRGEGIKDLEEDLGDVEQKALSLKSIFGGLFAGLTVGFLVKEFAQLSDEMTNLQNRLRVVTDSEQELADVQAELFEISKETRSELSATSTIFTRLAFQADTLGKSNRELLGFTKSLNQAIILSGASATEASAGLIQLSQGLAAGALRGDEFRSVSEQIPVVLDVIAEQTGKTRAEIRAMAFEGELTAEVIIGAFERAAGSLEERFATSVPSIGQAFVVLRNEVLKSVGAFNEATGASRAIAQSILFLADNSEAAAVGVGVLSTALLFAANTAFPAAAAAAKTFAVAALPFVALAGAAALATAAVAKVKETIEETEDAVQNLNREATLSRFGVIGDDIARAEAELAAFQQTGVILNRTSEELRFRLEALRLEQQNLRIEAERGAESDLAAAAAKKINSEAARAVIADLEEEARLISLSTQEREIQEEISKRAAELKKKDIDLSDERLTALRAEIEELVRLNAESQRQADLLQQIRGPAEEYAQIVTDLEVLLRGGAISQEEFNAALERFGEQVDPVADFVAEFAKLAEIAKQSAIEDQRKLEQLARQIDLTGQLQEQERQLRELRLQEPELTNEIAIAIENLKLRQLEASTELGAGFERAFIKIRREAEDLASVGESIVNVFADQATNAILEFARTGQLSFKEFASAIVDDLLQIITRLLIVRALSAFIPGAGAATTLAGGLNFGGGGGVPSFQHGGRVRQGEVVRVGEGGSELFVPDSSGTIVPHQASLPGATQEPPRVTVVNVSDSNEFSAAIASGDLDDVIINVVARNPERFKSVMGAR